MINLNGIKKRTFDWISSNTGDQIALDELERSMAAFYCSSSTRERYQKMLNESNDAVIDIGGPADAILRAILSAHPENILEVGCGGGKLFGPLRERGYDGPYLGIELSDEVIVSNRERYPNANWEVGSAYKLPAPTGSVALVFSFYVLEHCVRPSAAILEMIRAVKVGGEILLVFPDFVRSGRLASQHAGLSAGFAHEKIRSKRFVDAIITLYDTRVRLKRALDVAAASYGPFPINLNPICLDRPDLMWADIDAVYIASKKEIEHFAISSGCEVTYPEGTIGLFADHAFMRLRKL